MARAAFRSDWTDSVPPVGEQRPVTCPVCGSGHAVVERVALRLYGSHDGPTGCGWTASAAVHWSVAAQRWSVETGR